MDDLDGIISRLSTVQTEARLQASLRRVGSRISRELATIVPSFYAALVAGFIVAFSPNAMGQKPPAKSDATSITIPMELRAGRPVIHVTVNGGGPFLFLVSPDAETTLIDKTFAVKLRLKASRETGPQAEVQLEIGSTKLAKVPVMVTDLAQLAPEFSAATRPGGVLPLSLWKGQLVTIDYPRWRVTIEPGPLPEANGKDLFDLGPSRELTVPVSAGERFGTVQSRALVLSGDVVAGIIRKRTGGKWSPYWHRSDEHAFGAARGVRGGASGEFEFRELRIHQARHPVRWSPLKWHRRWSMARRILDRI